MLAEVALIALLGAPVDAARVVSVRGGVTIDHREPGGASSTAASGAIVHEGDVVRTSTGSAARLAIGQDRAVVDVGPNSNFELETIGGSARPTGALVRLKLLAGRLWANVTSGRGDFQVASGTAVAGVRGTNFCVDVAADGNTQVTVLEGQVEVGGASGGGAPKLVGALEQATVDTDGSVRVDKVSRETIARLEVRISASAEDAGGQTENAMEGGGEQVSDADKPEASQSALARMKAILSKVLKYLSDARDQGDVVKLNCVNEKLTAIKGLLRVSELSDVQLQEALARRDGDAANHEYEKVAIALRKCEQLLAESEACVGELSVYAGDTEVQVETDESVTTEDPSVYVPPVIIPERPPAASPFQ
jgi:hypothetical protein